MKLLTRPGKEKLCLMSPSPFNILRYTKEKPHAAAGSDDLGGGTAEKGRAMEIKGFDALARHNVFPIHIGTGLNVKIEGIAIPITSVFVGMEKNEYIIIAPPSPFHTIKHKLFPGNELVVGYLHEGFVYGFQSKLIEMIYKPRKMTLLEYPVSIEKRHIRSAKRTCCVIPAKIEFENEKRECVVTDINKNGCLCQIVVSKTKNLPSVRKDDTVTLLCQFPGINGEFRLSGVVRNTMKIKSNISFGISYDRLSSDVEAILDGYLATMDEFS